MEYGKPHWTALVFGLGANVICYFSPHIWGSMPPYVAWAGFCVGVLLMLYGLSPLSRKFPLTGAGARLISLTDLLRHIEIKHMSWAKEAEFITQLGAELKQGGYDQVLHFSGRLQGGGNEHTIKNATLVEIPREHWQEFDVCLLDAFVWTNTGNLSSVQTDNLRATTYVPGNSAKSREAYADLHLVRSEALKWLKNR